MASPLELESLGDWNNLKGTEYHFVYTLWLLLCEKVPFVAFFRGNDLFTSSTPASKQKNISSVPALHIQQPYEQEQDIWIQLKATEKPWTLTELAKENLLANFLYNALCSEREGKTWKVRLITQAKLRAEKIEEFLNQPQSNPKFLKSYEAILSQVQQKWLQVFQCTIDSVHLRTIADTVLRQLTETRPVWLETLKAQIETQIAYQCSSSEEVNEIAQRLLGELLTDTARGPAFTTPYTPAWIEQTVGLPLISGTLLTNDLVKACAESLSKALSPRWGTSPFVARTFVTKALNQFLSAPQTLFILIGMSGVGKSWVMADWTTQVLSSHARLLIKGSEWSSYSAIGARELSTLVASKLRSYAPTNWSDETIFRRVLSSPTSSGSDCHLVIVIDDLYFPTGAGEKTAFQQSLVRLIEQCRERNVKLVLTCQKHTWNAYRLDRIIHSQDLFIAVPDETSLHEQALEQANRLYSLLLGDFTAEEIQGILEQRFARDKAEQVALRLQSPAFALLRNPYFLDLYLRQYGASLDKTNIIPLVDSEALLKERVCEALRDVAERIGCDQDQVNTAFEMLQQRLWETRPAGLTLLEVLGILQMHFLEPIVLHELRRVGILTTENPVRFAEPVIADYLYATLLKGQIQIESDIQRELRPEIDTGVVSAFLRIASEPVLWAERFLTTDSRWRAAVAEGLSQLSAEDYVILSLLSILARPKANIIGHEACEALGYMASRGERAWNWVQEMYLSERIQERFRGERALATALNYIPDRVEATIQHRLDQVAQADASERDKREQLLQGALTPLFNIKHSRAAEVGRRIIHQYGILIEQSKSHHGRELLKDLDIIRGQIALVIGEGEIHELLIELRADDPYTRCRAAYALRPLVFECPEKVQDALCEAIRQEQEGQILSHLLWAAYRLEVVAPAMLLDSLEASRATRWQEPSPSAAIALAILADIADQYPSRVEHLLPKYLEAYELWERMLMSEMLTYAWWRCAEASKASSARAHLSSLIDPDVTDLLPEFRLFALRGTAIAHLGTICLDLEIPSTLLSGHQVPYPLGSLQFFYLGLAEFITMHASSLKTHPQFEQWCATLATCVSEEMQVSLHPANELRDVRHLCALSCKDILYRLNEATLPTWQDPEESTSYLALDDFRKTAEFATLTQASPDAFLLELDQQIRDEIDLLKLYYLKEAVLSWPILLISRVYARMFDRTPIDKKEALELCVQILTALAALPASPEQLEYQTTYEAILRSLDGHTPFLILSPSGASTLQKTHAYALSFLQSEREAKDISWLREALYHRQGWWETNRYQLADDGVSMGTHAYTVYVFPAVRLASIAVGQYIPCEDPAALFMEERFQVKGIISEHLRSLDIRIPLPERRLLKTLAAFEESLKKYPYDERLWQCQGEVLLRLGKFAEAETSLQHCISLPWCVDSTQASAYYNLGCVYARMAREDECRQMLMQWSQLQPENQLNYQWLRQDPDLKEMHEKRWFHDLCNSA